MGIHGTHVSIHLGEESECWGECLNVPRIGEQVWFGDQLFSIEDVVWGIDDEGPYAEVWLWEVDEDEDTDDLDKEKN